jgi:hypothetical protein
MHNLKFATSNIFDFAKVDPTKKLLKLPQKWVNLFLPTKVRKVRGINFGALSHIRGADLSSFCCLSALLPLWENVPTFFPFSNSKVRKFSSFWGNFTDLFVKCFVR